MGRRVTGTSLLLLLIGSPAAISAADRSTLILAGSDFVESLMDRPVVAGNLLVGVNWAAPKGKFDPAQLVVSPPSNPDDRTACISVASEDGRYSSINLFHIPSNVISPASIQNRSKKVAVLRSYDHAQIGVVVRMAKSCNDPKPGQILPVRLDAQAGPPSALVVKLNAAPGDVVIGIEGPGANGTPGSCQLPQEGVKVAFGAECTIAVSPLQVPATYTLKVKLQELFQSEEVKFDLWLTP